MSAIRVKITIECYIRTREEEPMVSNGSPKKLGICTFILIWWATLAFLWAIVAFGRGHGLFFDLILPFGGLEFRNLFTNIFSLSHIFIYPQNSYSPSFSLFRAIGVDSILLFVATCQIINGILKELGNLRSWIFIKVGMCQVGFSWVNWLNLNPMHSFARLNKEWELPRLKSQPGRDELDLNRVIKPLCLASASFLNSVFDPDPDQEHDPWMF